MTVGQIAGLIAALAVVALVALLAVPLLKLGGVLDQLRTAVRDLDDSTVPILEELKGTVTVTNDEIAKIGDVTTDVHTVSEHVTEISSRTNELSKVFTETVGTPMVKVAGLAHGIRQAGAAQRAGRLGRRARRNS
ncbi:DUF948 domain-containing protein [Acidipropionibacterium jensenii]|uniref:DUF948 domain-containing protein n=1 Tax=Acidipropionibacterium jensenii TaxID=1749 RepID=A0A3S4VHJ6_9ACTN|nr:DUF948 domain-containing protein [Acidipropionibacterium jensenii]AZZ42112.1 DUF948 domain-containing protein [Acidipropionibacterium jensenii]QCV88915.1 DUF948 domain-containing protein [Acidipropionibacterium jensenii]VEI02131.1 Uncharacterized protein containing a divergent version of the methyl-accepting chemotaxis-like domain [Acidipropionibacterium jensenii]